MAQSNNQDVERAVAALGRTSLPYHSFPQQPIQAARPVPKPVDEQAPPGDPVPEAAGPSLVEPAADGAEIEVAGVPPKPADPVIALAPQQPVAIAKPLAAPVVTAAPAPSLEPAPPPPRPEPAAQRQVAAKTSAWPPSPSSPSILQHSDAGTPLAAVFDLLRSAPARAVSSPAPAQDGLRSVFKWL